MTFLVPADHKQDPHVGGRSCGDPMHQKLIKTSQLLPLLGRYASEAAWVCEIEKVLQGRTSFLHSERNPADLKRGNRGSSKEARRGSIGF